MKLLSIEFTVNHIYIYEQKCGKKEVTVLNKYKVDMPANAYFNRMLINNDRRISDAIKNCVAENKIKTKKVVLTTSGIDCMVENLSILDGNKKQIDGMVEQELRKRHKLNADYLYDYVILGPDPAKDGFKRVQVTLCVKALIQNAYDIVKKAGLVPHKIVFSDQAMEKMAKLYRLTNTSDNSVIACINQDEAHYLYVGCGQEPYYRYSKLKNEQKMEENFFILSNIKQNQEEDDFDELVERKSTEDLTRLMRFHSQRNPGKEIANIYLYGCYEKTDALAVYLENALNIPVKQISLQKDLANVKYKIQEDESVYSGVAAAIASQWEKEQYDFFGRLEETKAGGSDKLLFLPTVIAVMIFFVILFFTYNNRMEAKEINAQAEAIVANITSAEVVQAYEEKNRMIDICNAYTKYNEQVTEAIDLLETMPRFERVELQRVDKLKPEGISITGYIFEDGTMNLGCYATDQYAPADYARILEESGNYEAVSYSGFQKGRGALGEEYYTFMITIKMW